MSKRIVILMHENTRFGDQGRRADHLKYFVTQLAQYWREEGLEVWFFNNPTKPIAGDLLFVHVDLSVVPESYLALAKYYPASVNSRVKDIRKSVISKHIVGPDDGWEGPVIVKTDLNFAGLPEQYYNGVHRPNSSFNVQSPSDYPIYPHRRDVPVEFFENTDLVVERFLPEMIGDRYCVRSYNFLGDREDTFILYSSQPVVKLGTISGIEYTGVHPEIRELRHALGFDYGKFDYVVRDGHAILFDANSTPGHLPVKDAETAALLRRRAQGIHSLFA